MFFVFRLLKQEVMVVAPVDCTVVVGYGRAATAVVVATVATVAVVLPLLLPPLLLLPLLLLIS